MGFLSIFSNIKNIAIGIVLLIVIGAFSYLYITANNRLHEIDRLTIVNRQLETDKANALQAVTNVQESLRNTQAELTAANNANRQFAQSLNTFNRNISNNRNNLRTQRTTQSEITRNNINRQVQCLLALPGDVNTCSNSTP